MRPAITYTVRYSRYGLFWHKIKNVEGDGFVPPTFGKPNTQKDALRFFKKLNGEMIYIPANYLVHFSKERDIAIRDKVNQETGKA